MSERSTIDRVLILGGKPSAAKSWAKPDVLPPSMHGWMGYEQKNFMNAGVQPVPMHIRQPHIANWADWHHDLMIFSDLLLASNAAYTALIGQSAGAAALLWLLQDYPGFAVEKFIMVDPWKPGGASEHTDFERKVKNPIDDLNVFRRIGELILVISSDDDAGQPEVAAFTSELIDQAKQAMAIAEEETARKDLETPIHSAGLTVIDMLGRGHFIQLEHLPVMTDLLTAQHGMGGEAMIKRHGATVQSDGSYLLADTRRWGKLLI